MAGDVGQRFSALSSGYEFFQGTLVRGVQRLGPTAVQLNPGEAQKMHKQHFGLQARFGLLSVFEDARCPSQGGREGSHQASWVSRIRASSVVATVSMRGSRAPPRISGRLWKETSTRWSVTRFCGKL